MRAKMTEKATAVRRTTKLEADWPGRGDGTRGGCGGSGGGGDGGGGEGGGG